MCINCFCRNNCPGFGLLFKHSPGSTSTVPQYSLDADSEERKTLVFGTSDIFSVYVQDSTYETVLSALSFRDYLETETGCLLPVVLYDADTSKWLGLTHQRQQQCIFSFTTMCQRHICVCHDSLCESPSLPFYSPPAMGINLNRYTEMNQTNTNTNTNTTTNTTTKTTTMTNTTTKTTQSLLKVNGESEVEAGHAFPIYPLQFVGSWPCSTCDFLQRAFVLPEAKKARFHSVWSLVEMGMIER